MRDADCPPSRPTSYISLEELSAQIYLQGVYMNDMWVFRSSVAHPRSLASAAETAETGHGNRRAMESGLGSP